MFRESHERSVRLLRELYCYDIIMRLDF